MSEFTKYNKTLNAEGTQVRIGCRFSYAYLFSPRPRTDDGAKEKYGVCLLIPKEDTATIKLIEKAVAAASDKGKSSVWNGRVPANLKTPLRDGDDEHPDDPNFEGMMFMNASSTRQPGIQVKELGEAPVDAFDEDDFYSGCWGAAAISFGPYDARGSKGVACYVNNVCKTKDDTKLGGGRSASADFSDLAD